MATDTEEFPTVFLRQFGNWGSRVGLTNKLALALTVAAIVAGIATYAALTETTPFGTTDTRTVTLLLTLDLILLLLLGALIARRIVQLWIKRRRGQAGSRLHIRLVAVFSVLAVTPAIVVATFSTIFFYVGVQEWFSDRVSTAVNESLAVARAYVREHQQNIRADVLAMANDLNQEAPRLIGRPGRFRQVLSTQAALRGLSEAIVFDGTTGQTLARSGFSFALTFEPVSPEALERARAGEVVVLVNDSDDRVRALVRLDRYVDSYLFVGRFVESRVLGHMEKAAQAVREYSELQGSRSNLQITVTLIFVMVALLLLLAAVWTGLNFANALVTPISALVAAAERVRAGDLAVRVTETARLDELGTLNRAFNRMTQQLASQREDLIEANHQLDQRRRFTEAVLGGVSAGVLGLDREGRIHLPNLSAVRLLGKDHPGDLVGRPVTEIAPEMGELFAAIQRRPGRPVESQVVLRQPPGQRRTLLVRIVGDAADGEIRGYVATFDDISELLSAQRKAAWADVARRIAHEIKNPLTPIQLSAERLRRKYLKEIESDKETFDICVNTIIRQVIDIGRMVDEFSAFARMPGPVMKEHNLHDLVRQAGYLQQHAHGNIQFRWELPEARLVVPCDGRQISQALTNLLQNAVDAIDGRPPPADGRPLPPGEVTVRLSSADGKAWITVEDNGKGLPPEEDRLRLTEPYVTTRSKGTGLGLAIVRKIMEDHGGDITLDDRPGGGARVSVMIPFQQQLRSQDAADHRAESSEPMPQTQSKQTAHGS